MMDPACLRLQSSGDVTYMTDVMVLSIVLSSIHNHCDGNGRSAVHSAPNWHHSGFLTSYDANEVSCAQWCRFHHSQMMTMGVDYHLGGAESSPSTTTVVGTAVVQSIVPQIGTTKVY